MLLFEYFYDDFISKEQYSVTQKYLQISFTHNAIFNMLLFQKQKNRKFFFCVRCLS